MLCDEATNPTGQRQELVALLASLFAFMLLLRQLDHSGIALSHYTFDRALHDSLFRKLAQGHEEFFSQLGDKDLDGELRLSWLKNWVIGTACCLQDVQNGPAWGLKRFLSDGQDSLRNIYAVVEGLRHGYSELLRALPRFLEGHIRFVESDLDPAILATFWRALDVPHEDESNLMLIHMVATNAKHCPSQDQGLCYAA